MKRVAWGLVIALGVLHYDFWYWDDDSLVFGFLPVGLAFHAALSVAAGIAWALVVKFAWPAHIEAWAEQSDGADA